MPEVEHISLQEIRRDLAGFFRLVDDGRKFAVYQHSRPLAQIGKVGNAADLKIAQPMTPAWEVEKRVSDLIVIVDDARKDIEHTRRLKLLGRDR